MTSLLNLKPERVVKALERTGWKARKRTGGSHVHLFKEGNPYILTVPVHKGRDLKPGLLAGLLKKAGLTPEEFLNLYRD
ncbi:MAG: type II toxin-antitoxin system HicA family toxin [Pseudomonadota bacterium]